MKIKTLIEDAKLLARDLYYWLLDNIQDVSHFALRIMKIITEIITWKEDLGEYIETKLEQLRNLIKELKNLWKQ
jgi:hypothetical protein